MRVEPEEKERKEGGTRVVKDSGASLYCIPAAEQDAWHDAYRCIGLPASLNCSYCYIPAGRGEPLRYLYAYVLCLCALFEM